MELSNRKNVSIIVVILGYNSRHFLEECLVSLEKTDYPHDIIFIDNASEDASVQLVRERFPYVRVFEMEKNVGFAAGNNYALDIIKKEKTHDAIFLLNPDTIVDPNIFTELSRHYSKTSILQPVILTHKDGKATEVINTKGNPLHYLGFSYAGENGTPFSTEPFINEVMIGSGAALFVPFSVLEQVGGFDDSFFMYHEDVDFSYRSRLQGNTILCISTARVWHKYHFSRNTNKFYFSERNRHWFILKNFQLKTLLLIAPMFVLTEIFMVIYSLTQGWAIMKFRAYISTLQGIPSVLKSRQLVQDSRVVSDKALFPLMSGDLRFSEVGGLPLKLYSVASRLYWYFIRLT